MGGSGAGFVCDVWNVVENYPPQTLRLLMNHVGTHDTERVLTLLGGEPSCGRGRAWQAERHLSAEERALALRRLRLATLLQFALPGVPCIYYGDEAGMEGYRDPFNRGTYPWGCEDADLLAWYRTLGARRREIAALAEGAFYPVPTADETVCFVRRDGESALLCAVNRGYTESRVSLPADFIGAEICVGDGWVWGHELVLPPLSGIWMRL